MYELSVHLPSGGVAAAETTGKADDIAEGGCIDVLPYTFFFNFLPTLPPCFS